jgi:hypothetical protein
MNIRLAYKTLLRLYPPDHRAVFADEMLSVFEEVAEEQRQHTRVIFARFVAEELTHLLMGAAAEWNSKIAYDVYRSANLVRRGSLLADWIAHLVYAVYNSNSSFRSRCVPDLRMLRPPGVSWESFYGARTYRSEDGA